MIKLNLHSLGHTCHTALFLYSSTIDLSMPLFPTHSLKNRISRIYFSIVLSLFSSSHKYTLNLFTISLVTVFIMSASFQYFISIITNISPIHVYSLIVKFCFSKANSRCKIIPFDIQFLYWDLLYNYIHAGR